MKNNLHACRLFGSALVEAILTTLDSDNDGIGAANEMPVAWEQALNAHGWMRGWVRS